MSGGNTECPVGLVLAGGEASRFGSSGKALAPLHGQPLLQHVLDRLRPQANPVLLSVHSNRDAFAAFGHETVADVVERQRGPLTGLVSGLLRLECRGYGEWLVLSPCDAPFLPPDLVSRLGRRARSENRPVAVARYGGVVQPVFSMWHLEALPVVKEAVMERGRGGLMTVLDEIPHAVVDWPEQTPPPFFNVNTPEELTMAAQSFDALKTGG